MRLEGKRVLVTGASRGLGRAIARACAAEGAIVGVNYHSSEAGARQLCEEIERDEKRAAHSLRFDVASAAEVEKGVERFCEQAGGVDALVNNAARFEGGLLATMPADAVERLLSVNLAGAIHCARAVLPRFLQQRAGVILNIGSVSASRPNPGQSVYVATKSALEGFTRALAIEYARKHIRVLCLCPGPLNTEMLAATRALAGDRVESRVPLGRLGSPEEAARFAVQLLSDGMSFATGAIYPLDGGYLVG
jgi:3-oxoacyl-[acyl-carrier protein] reductase